MSLKPIRCFPFGFSLDELLGLRCPSSSYIYNIHFILQSEATKSPGIFTTVSLNAFNNLKYNNLQSTEQIQNKDFDFKYNNVVDY